MISRVKPRRKKRRVNINSGSPLSATDNLTAVDVLSESGPLSEVLTGFSLREGQVELAESVEQAISSGNTLIAEAGTGIGKTFAYLAPALLATKKIIISTGTRHLQDQLFNKDLPTLRQVVKRNLDAVLLKGRANYLCHYRLKKSMADIARQGHQDFVQLKRLEAWASSSQTGDKAEHDVLPEEHRLWPRVTSNQENCLGQECPDYSRCFVVKARRAAQDADLVVINHHLFCADLALRDAGFGELLPDAEVIIIDEAHQLPEIATGFFGRTLGSRQLQDLSRDTIAELLADAPDMPDAIELFQALPVAVARLRHAMGMEQRRAAWHPALRRDHLHHAVKALESQLEELTQLLEAIAERSQGLQTCFRRCLLLYELLGSFQQSQENYVHWFETTKQGFILHQTPLDIADIFQDYQQGLSAAWIFTSATLAVGSDFSHFSQRLGISDAETGQWKSPFDYQQHSLLYCPENLPIPADQSYTHTVIDVVKPLLLANPGGSFFLFTSYRALEIAAQSLKGTLDRPVLVQGEAPKQRLLETFRDAGNAVLLATSSFWEGVDVRGQALSCVIIDKLPFASPGDPVLEARLNGMREKGANPFIDYQLPLAVIALKQGAGRLIRDVDDYGMLVICDPRLRSKPYGKRFLASLPDMPRTTEADKALEFLARLA